MAISTLPQHEHHGPMSDVRDMPNDEHPPDVLRGSAELERALAVIQHRTVLLMCAITAVRYLAAWLEKRELEYAIERAERIARALSESSGRDDVMRRLDELIAVSDRILALAPAPSPSAIRQARSSDRRADRSDWEREEQQWAIARQVIGPFCSSASPARGTCPPDVPPGRSRIPLAASRTVELEAGEVPAAFGTQLCNAGPSRNAD